MYERRHFSDLEMARIIAEKVAALGGHTYYVGGYVRDQMMGIENKDIDIEIHGITVESLEEILKEVGKPTEMGKSFGIFGLRGFDLDIAMPRKEEATGRGHKDFKVDVDPFLGTYKAAIRRDFTMNALMQDVLTGEIVDHFGGLADLKVGLLKHVNDKTFAEDPLRVLRSAQFAARFEFAVAKETIALAKEMDLSSLASERIMGELEKALLKARHPSIFFREMRKMQQLSFWFPEIEAGIGVMQNPTYHPEGDVWTHTMLVLDQAASFKEQANQPLPFMMAALMHDLGKPESTKVDPDGRIRSWEHENKLDTIQNALSRITNVVNTRKYVLNMVRLHMLPNQMACQKASQNAMNRLFDQSIDPADLLLLAKADHFGRQAAADYTEIEAFLKKRYLAFQELMAKPYVMGRDLIEAGLKPEASFSELLSFAHKLRLSGVPKEKALAQTLAMARPEQEA